MKLRKLMLENFKGVTRAEYNFHDKTVISAKNGVGKSTLLDGYMWVMVDKDSKLNSNPDIRPNDGRECTPKVTIEFDTGDAVLTVSKSQKCKETEKDEKKVVSYTNFYEVNCVEVSKATFEKRMAEHGIDLKNFAALSHPDVFLNGMNEKKNREQIRETLFTMAKTRSDLEIVTGKAELKDIAKMLENYSVEEITAMQNSSLRKIREEYGKKGEILRAKIEGLELAKADIDTAELELQKNALNEQIEDVKAKQDDLSKQLEEIDKESNGIVKLKCELNELVRQANENLVNQKSELRSKICDLEAKIRTYSSEIYKCQSDIDFYTDLIKKSETNRQSLAEQWKSVKAEEFDKETTICPTCHRELPQEDVERLLSEFETTKAERLDKIKESGLKAKETIEEAKTKLDELNNRLSLCVKQNDGIELELKSLNKELSELPGSVDISNREDVVALNEQIKAKEQAVNSYNDNSGKKVEFANKLFELQNQLTEVNKQIALANRNVEIDENITELRSKQREYEQNKADCEKILSQLDLLSRLKNELAADDINSHYFKIVKWKLYDYQKNGEYKSTCIPLIDGYEFGTATNKGREVLAKLDIISGLQNFYGVDYPVFIDNAECLSNDTISRIDMDCQLIMLKVSEDKEITVMEV